MLLPYFNYGLTLRSRETLGVSIRAEQPPRFGGRQQDWFPSFETHAFGGLLRMR